MRKSIFSMFWAINQSSLELVKFQCSNQVPWNVTYKKRILLVTNMLWLLRKMHKQSQNWSGVQYPLKVGCFDCILIPQGETGNSAFLGWNESPYFSHYNTKISASNSLYLRSYNRKCTYFRYTNFDFVTYFSNSLIPKPHPQCHILILASGEKLATLK